jgi:RNA polymerase sigma-70 factor (ECF subfamily)
LSFRGAAANSCAVPPPHTDQTRWFAEELQPHEPSLRAWLHRTFQAADVDDLVQESYARVLRARAHGEVRSAKSFLFTVARNAVRDLLRRRATARAETITENILWPVLEDRPGVVDLVSRRQELAVLGEAIRDLPDRCRQVFLLRKIQGLSQREIAVRLGITENTVETLVAKGARRCADYVRAHCDVPLSR